MITSPCVKVCKVDEQGRCQGCERTSDEISGCRMKTARA